MRVLHAVTLHSPSHAFGGPVRVALNLAKGLRDRGHEARLLALGEGFPEPWPTSVEGVPAKLFPARRLLPLGFSGMTSPALLASAGRLVRDADVVHVHLARDLVTLPVALAALRARKPLVLQTHGMVDPSEKLLAKVLDAVAVRRLLRGADALLYLTPHEREGLDAVVGRSLPQAVRLVNGTPAQDERPALSGPPRLLYSARLQARKRPVDFVDAAPAILAAHPDAEFVVAGPDEGEAAAVRDRIAALGLSDRFTVPGALSGAEVLTELRRAHVYVLPSVEEPFPMSVLEALAVGVPSVVTHSNGLARDIAAAGAGLAVDPGPAGVAAAVLSLLDPPCNASASRAARELAAASYSMDAVLDTLLPVYEKAAATHTV
ncbi:glycosyltransferase [Streptomyces sp. APSN-46.1]|uniref:glycosyltransferase n=1 Tax=Streptomyces sp. APSN-46.1 TaxID=2929049 RepID=UPI001FB43CDB|nr:glycosyltransferase [Streptomyces sp. APSN-46.1]MCJ1680863.1 glycosyltransferase [Streptomyces sp. APSN-46.1]